MKKKDSLGEKKKIKHSDRVGASIYKALTESEPSFNSFAITKLQQAYKSFQSHRGIFNAKGSCMKVPALNKNMKSSQEEKYEN